MKKSTYTLERVSLKEYLKILKSVKLPGKYWVLTILYFAASFAMIPVSLMLSTFSAEMVGANGQIPTEQLTTFIIGYVLIGVITAFSSVFLGVVSERINYGMRSSLWKRIIRTQQSCYDRDNGETLVSRVTTDCDYASKLYSTVISLITTAASSIGYVFSMFALSVKLSAYMMILIPLSILIGWVYAKLMYQIADKKQAMLAHSTTYLIERTRDLNLVKMSNTQEQEAENGKGFFEEQYKMQIEMGLMSAFYTALQTAFNIISIAVPFAAGAMLVKNGQMQAADVVAFYAISASVGTFFTNLIQYAGTVKQANGAMARVTTAMELPVEETEQGNDLDCPDDDLVLDHVTFGYEEGQAILKDISCIIPKKKVTAIVGVNGSGKSTLFKLLERFYEPQSGTIRFGKQDAKNFRLDAWRKAVGMVAQGSPLLEGTIRENMCYGCEREITKEEFLAVARASHVADFAETLPERYETLLSAGGENLSGGQRQCIGIARAMMYSPDYLLLDEATSNLDAKKEHAVWDALSTLMKERTTVIIAHSLTAIRNADHVIVLADGRVQETGSPQEILARSDNYLEKIMNRTKRVEEGKEQTC